MSRSDTLTAPGRPEDIRALSDEVSRLFRLVHPVKAHLGTGVGSDAARERAAHVLLFPLARLGPLRQGALAELMHSDPSTISRHVTLLVDRGLVRRVADATDGRASRLVVTTDGEAVTEAMRRERELLFDRVTHSWPQEMLDTFTGLLHRFVEDLTDVLPDLDTVVRSDSSTTSEKDR